MARHQPLRAFHWPSNESAEISSMGLEFLAHPHFERFFGESAERMRRAHLEDSLGYMLWDTSADAFQHAIYGGTEAPPGRCHQIWRQAEATFLPWRRYRGLPWLQGGHGWQTYALIHREPFYGIDYALALVCALQFWARAREDRAGALAAYATLGRLGGSRPFLSLIGDAGLDSPFEPGTVARVVDQVVEELAL